MKLIKNKDMELVKAILQHANYDKSKALMEVIYSKDSRFNRLIPNKQYSFLITESNYHGGWSSYSFEITYSFKYVRETNDFYWFKINDGQEFRIGKERVVAVFYG